MLGKRPLRPHQIDASKIIRRLNGRAGVFMAPGTGKTLVAERFAVMNPPVLVGCRRDDFLTWITELDAEGIDTSKVWQIDSEAALDKLILEASQSDDPYPPAWTLVTYDLVRNPAIQRFIQAQPYKTVIGDELHSIKRMESERTKAFIRATRHIPYRIGLTGSPITNDCRDIFSQCYFIDDGKTFGTKEWSFLNKYYLKSGHGWYLRRGAKELISAKLKEISFHVHEDDVLKLPPKRYVTKAAPLSPEQAKLYMQVLTDWELELGGDNPPLEIDHVIVQLAKLRQISGGFFYGPDGNARRLPCPKLDLLVSLADDAEYMGKRDKIIVWCAHTDEIERIAETVKEKAVVFYGSKRSEKEAARKSFQKDKSIRWFIGQVDAGVGMNELVCAADAVYYSNSFKVVSRQQSERRNRRIGSEHHDRITYWDLLSEGTVDKRVLRGVRYSMDIAAGILEELKQGKKLSRVLNT